MLRKEGRPRKIPHEKGRLKHIDRRGRVSHERGHIESIDLVVCNHPNQSSMKLIDSL